MFSPYLKETFSQQKHAFFLGMTALCIGILIGWTLRTTPPSSDDTQLLEQVRTNPLGYSLINPLLYIRTSKNQSALYVPLENEVAQYINAHTRLHQNDLISFYFRDLNEGRWTGVNEDQTYTPSSMLKVAVMMSILKRSEANTEILSKKLFYDASKNTAQRYEPEQKPSDYYTIDELMNMMIVNSDNEANRLLMESYNSQFDDLYATFQLPDLPANYQNFMSPRAYSTLFRTLYGATYLSENNSEKALSLLASSTFERGIRTGVPEDIIVASKFGENSTARSNGEIEHHQLHDCGIVYYPPRPYFICIMTQGSDFDELEKVIADISKITYQKVSEGLLDTSDDE